jgi:hypothetical protein
VKVAKGQKGDAGAVFDLAPKLGSVSDKRAANGGVMACVKKAKKTRMRRVVGLLPHSKRGAARLAGFMPGPGAGMNHD